MGAFARNHFRFRWLAHHLFQYQAPMSRGRASVKSVGHLSAATLDVSVHRDFLGLDDRIRQGYGAMAEVLHAIN